MAKKAQGHDEKKRVKTENKEIEKRSKKNSVKLADTISSAITIGDRAECKICQNPYLRFFIMDQYSKGYAVSKIRENIKNEFNYCPAQQVIDRHLQNHETQIMPWLGMVKYKFHSEEERKRFETAFLSRLSLVLELWDKYSVLSELFSILAGSPNNINPSVLSSDKNIDRVERLAAEMRSYLETMLKLQKERDVYVEVSKVVLYTMADNLVSNLSSLISDLSPEKREAIGKLIVDEVKKALAYAKSFGKEKISEMMDKVNAEYAKIVNKG